MKNKILCQALGIPLREVTEHAGVSRGAATNWSPRLEAAAGQLLEIRRKEITPEAMQRMAYISEYLMEG